jgi:hypothetical protein
LILAFLWIVSICLAFLTKSDPIFFLKFFLTFSAILSIWETHSFQRPSFFNEEWFPVYLSVVRRFLTQSSASRSFRLNTQDWSGYSGFDLKGHSISPKSIFLPPARGHCRRGGFHFFLLSIGAIGHCALSRQTLSLLRGDASGRSAELGVAGAAVLIPRLFSAPVLLSGDRGRDPTHFGSGKVPFGGSMRFHPNRGRKVFTSAKEVAHMFIQCMKTKELFDRDFRKSGEKFCQRFSRITGGLTNQFWVRHWWHNYFPFFVR